jgi:hypothetical protein
VANRFLEYGRDTVIRRRQLSLQTVHAARE